MEVPQAWKDKVKIWREKASTSIKLFMKNKAGVLGLCITMTFVIMAIFSPYIAPYNPYKIVDHYLLPPSSKHPLGTNDIGQDILSELIYGARVSLMIGVLASVCVVSVGTIIGIVSGYYGGLIDEVLMRICDIVLVLPSLPLMILLASLLGTGKFYVLILAITLTAWPGLARLVRSAVLSLRERSFVEAARAIGASDAHIMIHHILPNVMPFIISAAVYRAAAAMMAEASLSFLGLGDPSHKSWGMILHYAHTAGGWWANYGKPCWWWIIPPGLCIALFVSGLMLMGQAIEEIVNPRLRRR